MAQLNPAPHELIAAPADLWIAPFGTAFPDIDDEPASPWEIISVGGSRSLGEEGITVQMPQSLTFHRTAGTTAPVKASRTEEDLIITATVHDMTVESFARVMGQLSSDIDTVAATPTTPGTKAINLIRGIDMRNYALLVRWPSPYLLDGVTQLEVPNVVMAGSPEPQFSKGELAGMEVQFQAIEDVSNPNEDERFGRLIAITAHPTP